MAAIRAAGIGPGSRCLEIGAGAGSISRWFAELAGDPRLVCAIDLDTRLLQPLVDEGSTVLQQDLHGAIQAWVDVIGRTGTDHDSTRTFPEPLQRHGYRDVVSRRSPPVLQGGAAVAASGA